MNENPDSNPIHSVAAEDACPLCGERHTDKLVWLDDNHVECRMCGTVYRPGAKDTSSE